MKTLTTGIALVLAATTAAAQTVRSADEETVKARQKISMMEGVLERAVQNGAENLFRQLRDAMPPGDSPRLIGAPQVRGFRLDGFGVFFDVEVPDLWLPPAWTLRYMMDQNGLTAATAMANIRALLPQVRDQQQRQVLEQALTRLEMQVGPPQGVTRLANGVPAATPAAQSVPRPAPVDPGIIEDPNEGFTREVKGALVEAMLENSSPIGVGPEEWLTIAARGNTRMDRLGVVGDSTDTHTIMFRVKGSDLAAFHENRISLDDAKKRVQVREY
jgi:hypothetical protein